MALGSRTSSLDQLDPEYDSNTQPRSPTKNDDHVDCHPPDSRGRRLFPQRRTSILTSVNGNLNVKRYFSPVVSLPSNVHYPVDLEAYDSKTGSPSSVDSVATVNVFKSPTSHWPSPEADSWFEEDAGVRVPFSYGSVPMCCSVEPEDTPHKDTDKSSKTYIPATLYTNARTRATPQWKSLAHFHQLRGRQSPRILSQIAKCENGPCHSDQSYDALIPTNKFFGSSLPFDTGPYQWGQSPKTTAHTKLSPIEVRQDAGGDKDTNLVTKDRSLLNVPAVETWDCTVKMSTVATVTGDGKLHVHHLAVLSVIMPKELVCAEKVGLSFMIFNALRTDHKCSLGPGQSSVSFEEDASTPGFFPREGAELIIVRDNCDLVKPLNLYFNFTYLPPWHSVMVSLPTVRPKKGRSLSEIVFIAETQPPLSMETYIRDQLSSWKLCEHPVSQITCYERFHIPGPDPVRFQDNIQMRFSELQPVRFRALGGLNLSSLIWKLDIAVHELPGEQIECRMSFLVEVGVAMALVTLIPHGWLPRYFIIDGCVATEKAGDCWKNKEGYITIFKQAHMDPGPIMVETYWQGSPKHGSHDVGSIYNLPLPRVANRKVLGGRLKSRAADIILLNRLGERLRPYGSVNGAFTLLPTMDTGYKILLKRVTEARHQKLHRPDAVRCPSLPIPDGTQLPDHSINPPNAQVKKGHRTVLSYTADNAKEVAAPSECSLHFLLLALLILLLLVPGCLYFVEHVRRGNDHTERRIWRDRDQDSFSREEEGHQVIIDVAGSDALKPAVVAVEKAVEVAKCEGWRDWIDYGSGWKGCVP